MASEQVIIEYRADIDKLRKDLDQLVDAQEEVGAGVKENNKIFFESEKARTAAINKEKTALKTLKAQREKAFNSKFARSEVAKLDKAITGQTAKLKKLEKSVVGTGKAIKKTSKESSSLSKSIGNVGISIAAAFSIGAITNFLNQTTKLTAEMDALRLSFEFIEGDKAGGAATFQFLTDLAEELGLELVSTAEAFKLFSGAARISGISAQETKRIFESVSFAVTALGLSAQKAESVFRALSQIISKGTVSSEELRQQMAEVLPGSFKIAANAMNLTEQEFNKLLATGTLLATDFLPKFATELRKTFEGGAVLGAQSLNAELNRIQNSVTDLTLEVGKNLAPAWLLVQKNTLLALAAAVKYAKFGVNLIRGNALDASNAIEEGANAFETVTKRVDDATDILTSVGVKAALARQIIIDKERKELEKRLKDRQAIVERFAEIEKAALKGLNFEERELAKARGILTGSEKLALKRADLRAQATRNELAAINELQLALDETLKKELELTVPDKVERQAFDVIALRIENTEALLALLDDEFLKNDKASKANRVNIQKEIEARGKQAASLRDLFNAGNKLSAKDKEILFKLKLEFDKATLDPVDAFIKLRDEAFKAFKDEEIKIDLVKDARIIEGIARSGATTEAEIAEVTKKEVDKANVLKAISYKEYTDLVEKVIKELGIFEEATYDETVEANKKANDEKIAHTFDLLHATADVFNQIASLSATLTDGRIDDLTREQTAFEDKINNERELLEDSRENRLITENEFQSRLNDLNNQEISNAERIRKEKAKIARKQAVIEKSAAVFSIGISTAEAIIATLAKTPPPAGIPLAALVAALGALQLATVLATPIPKFAKGTKDKKGSGMALVGEKGPEQTFLPSGTKVLPAKQTKRYGEVFDAMYDNKYEQYVTENFVTPALALASKKGAPIQEREAKIISMKQPKTYGQVFDAMYSNKFDQYITTNYVAPALEQQKRLHKAQENQDFASNIVNSIQETNVINSIQGFDYYDGLAIQKKGQKINNVDEIAKAIGSAIEVNSRRL